MGEGCGLCIRHSHDQNTFSNAQTKASRKGIESEDEGTAYEGNALTRKVKHG